MGACNLFRTRDYESVDDVAHDEHDLISRTGTTERSGRCIVDGQTLLKLKSYDRAEEALESCVDSKVSA